MSRAVLPALAMACALSTPGCGFAVKHPAITAGIAAGTLGFTTCKLASDNWEACGYVGGGAAAFLGLITAGALWLGGDGDSTGLDEPLPPLLEEGPPPPASEPPASEPPASEPRASEPPASEPANPPAVNQPSTNPPSTNPPSPNPPSPNPPSTGPPSPNPE